SRNGDVFIAMPGLGSSEGERGVRGKQENKCASQNRDENCTPRILIARPSPAFLRNVTDGAPLPARNLRLWRRVARAHPHCGSECSHWNRCACGRAECSTHDYP